MFTQHKNPAKILLGFLIIFSLVLSGVSYGQIKQFKIIRSFPTPDLEPKGLAWDGAYLWHSDGNNLDKLFRLNTSGTVVGQIPYNGSRPLGLCWMPNSTIGVADNRDDKIYRINSSNGSIQSQFYTVHGVVFAVEWDGSYLWHSDDNYAELYQTETNGTLRKTIPAPTKIIRGIAFDGQNLWVISGVDKVFYKISRADGTILAEYGAPVKNPTGLTWDGSRLWTCGAVNNEIVQLDFNCGSSCDVEVLVPDGGEVWDAGTDKTIVWSSCSTSGEVQIEYTVDGGLNWHLVIWSTEDDGRKIWSIPGNISGTQCKIRVSDPNSYRCYDESDDFFTINSGCYISVTAPNGGEVWNERSVQRITWTSQKTSGNVKILYSLNNGSSWAAIVNSTQDDGDFAWTLPEVHGDKTQCLIRIEDANDPNCFDVSNANFTIKDIPSCSFTVTAPNGGENWFCGTAYNITWTSTNASANVRIQYYCDGFWEDVIGSTPNDGVFTWSIPPGKRCNQALVRVTDVNDVNCSDQSNSYFTISCCNITVTAPNGGESWQCGSTHNITWNAASTSGAVKIEYLCDGIWYTITSNTPDDGIFSWTIPQGLKCSQALVRISDMQNSNCTDQSNSYFNIYCASNIKLLVPDRKVLWSPGTQHKISWLPADMSGNVKLEYSLNGGSSWTSIISSTPDDGCYDWLIPNVSSSQCKVRVTDTASPAYTDESDVLFTIGTGITPLVIATDVTGRSGNTVTTEIKIQNSAIATDAFGFDLNFDVNHLAFVRVEKGALTANWMQLSGNENTPGTIKIGGFNTTAIPVASTGIIARVVFQVTCNGCDDCSQSYLNLANLTDDLASVNAYTGTFSFSACLLGDVNMDGAITPGDALCAFNIYLNNQIPPAGECNKPCALMAADANCDGLVTPGDALLIFQAYLGGQALRCPTLSKAEYNPVERIVNLSMVPVPGNSSVRVPIWVTNPDGLSAFGLEVSYPREALELKGITRTLLTEQWIGLDAQENSPGLITVGGFNIDAIVASGSVILAELHFTLKANGMPGGRIEILHSTDDLALAKFESEAFSGQTRSALPSDFILEQNYPNPFNPETEIAFQLPIATPVRLTIYNLSGQKVITLLDQVKEPGRHRVTWNGKDDLGVEAPSGMYFYTLEAGAFIETRKMTFLK